MDVQPVEQIETRANMELVEDVMGYLETLTTKDREEDTEDYQELNFED